ncbi:Protein argonaute 4 -like protein [Gossypium arboreum]|uniref:Protein argonaute 4-like protein n=1 Tax=Gossypium arboreum TaxID=29729 RepID=A0A0B0PXF8_GOSAR|nr:Protein argonaute 4 -like protein [Gossypium arboreum]
MLTLGQTPSIPIVSKIPTIILGMGALFGFPEQSDVPSIVVMFLTKWMTIALLDFYTSSAKRKPDQIIIFRDRVSESQVNQGSPDNVLHGTVIDNKVCHPKNNDFYLGTHAGMVGITRQTHYHVLLDQAGFSADDLQEDASEISSSHGGMYAPGVISVPQL